MLSEDNKQRYNFSDDNNFYKFSDVNNFISMVFNISNSIKLVISIAVYTLQ